MVRSDVEDSQDHFESFAIFDGLSEEALERISRRCRWRRCEPDEAIVDHLDTSDEVFFVNSGDVRVTIYSLAGKAVSFRDLGGGTVFGEFPAIDGDARSASVEARKTSQLTSMSAAAFREILQAEPSVALALLRQYVMTIRSLTTRVYEFSTLAVNNRIQAEVLRLAQLIPQEGKRVRIDPAPTHVEIANRISTTREAVTRELYRLSRIGIAERQGSALLITDIDRPAAMVHEVTGE